MDRQARVPQLLLMLRLGIKYGINSLQEKKNYINKTTKVKRKVNSTVVYWKPVH